MHEEWLIDGYNLIHVLLRRSANSSMDVCKQKLFDLTASFARSADRRVMFVLDGKGNEEELRLHQTKNFNVVYSQAVSADSFIERFVVQNKVLGSAMVVITQDRAISRLVRGAGARSFDPGEFLEMLKSNNEETKDVISKHKTDAHGFNRPFQDKLKFLS